MNHAAPPITDMYMRREASLRLTKLCTRVKAKPNNDTKKINDVKQRGKNLIRIPEKLCRTLKVKKGEFVTVKPAQ